MHIGKDLTPWISCVAITSTTELSMCPLTSSIPTLSSKNYQVQSKMEVFNGVHRRSNGSLGGVVHKVFDIFREKFNFTAKKSLLQGGRLDRKTGRLTGGSANHVRARPTVNFIMFEK